MTTTVIPTYPKAPILAVTGPATAILSCPRECMSFTVTTSATPPATSADMHSREAGVPFEVIISTGKYLHVMTLNAASVVVSLC